MLCCAVAVATGVAAPRVRAAPMGCMCSPCNGGSDCNGQDPQATGCSADATTVPGQSKDIMYNGVSYGKVELRWSNTCGTNWVRIRTFHSIANAYITVWFGTRPPSGNGPYCNPSTCAPTTFATNQTYWTPMVYAPTSPAGGAIWYDPNVNFPWQEVDVQSA
jgi:hypothetical protein